jgi:hypothetical protein
VGHPLGPELGDEDLDPHLLMWDVHRNIDLDAVPPGRTVLRFSFRDVPAPGRVWWLVITRDGVDPYDTDPGFPVTATIETDLRTLTLIWCGDLIWAQAPRSGALDLHGPAQARRAVPRRLKLSAFRKTVKRLITGTVVLLFAEVSERHRNS